MDSFKKNFELEWQTLNTDLSEKPTFKVVLFGAYKQAEELLYTVIFIFIFLQFSKSIQQ
jgi:hypothetical protein